jgi:hypothetical protein
MTNSERQPSQQNPENEPAFMDKLRTLLPGVEFEETPDLQEARVAVLEALTNGVQDADLLRTMWGEYVHITEQLVDSQTSNDSDPQRRAQLQLATLVHKALLFREVGDIQRYGEDLTDAEDYAYNMHLDDIAVALTAELDSL